MADLADTSVGRFFSKCLTRHAFTAAGLLVAGVLGWNNLQRDVQHVEMASRANTEAIQSLDERLSTIERKQDVQSETLNNIQKSMKEAQDRDRESREDMKRSLDRIFQQLNRNRR